MKNKVIRLRRNSGLWRKEIFKKGQQEIVGFVLIVALVMVVMMVFLVYSLRDSPMEEDSLEVDNLLNSVMRKTTECIVSFEPTHDDFEDLFKSCYEGEECENLGKSACDYLNESLRRVLFEVMKSEASVSAYQWDFFEKESSGLLRIYEGECGRGGVSSAKRNLISGSDTLIVILSVCKEN